MYNTVKISKDALQSKRNEIMMARLPAITTKLANGENLQ